MGTGLFITFEGGEGAGKSTQIRRLHHWLEQQGHDAVMTREPGGTDAAEAVRGLVVSGHADRWTAKSELLLMLAARNDHVERMIKPALQAGKIVLCDRFSDSTVAYQGAGRDLGIEAVRALDAEWGAAGLVPDLTFLLDLPPEAGLARTGSRDGSEARFEGMDLGFHETLRAAFRLFAAEQRNRIKLVDAEQTEDEVFQIIRAAVSSRLGQ